MVQIIIIVEIKANITVNNKYSEGINILSILETAAPTNE